MAGGEHPVSSCVVVVPPRSYGRMMIRPRMLTRPRHGRSMMRVPRRRNMMLILLYTSSVMFLSCKLTSSKITTIRRRPPRHWGAPPPRQRSGPMHLHSTSRSVMLVLSRSMVLIAPVGIRGRRPTA